MSADLAIRPLSATDAAAETPVAASRPFHTTKAVDPAQKFEAFVLQTFIQDMMPKTTEGVFGSGIAGDFWRSLMSEKIAEQVAERGSLGIADMVRAGHITPTRPSGLVPMEVLSRLSTLEAAALGSDTTPALTSTALMSDPIEES